MQYHFRKLQMEQRKLQNKYPVVNVSQNHQYNFLPKNPVNPGKEILPPVISHRRSESVGLPNLVLPQKKIPQYQPNILPKVLMRLEKSAKNSQFENEPLKIEHPPKKLLPHHIKHSSDVGTIWQSLDSRKNSSSIEITMKQQKKLYESQESTEGGKLPFDSIIKFASHFCKNVHILLRDREGGLWQGVKG